jgi:hypothetical protein
LRGGGAAGMRPPSPPNRNFKNLIFCRHDIKRFR